jgi:hypothetical protein
MGRKEIITSIYFQYTNKVNFQFSKVIKTWSNFKYQKLPPTTEKEEETIDFGFTSERVKSHIQKQE